MTIVDKFPQGMPAWVDLQSPDQDASKQFYAQLLGWEYRDAVIFPDAVYAVALVDGTAVAAIAPQTAEAVAAAIPTVWNTYFAVDNLDAVLEKVGPAGGRIVSPAADVPGQGKQAVIEDGVGASSILWQAALDRGATLTDVPGAFVWHELAAGNWEHAVPFYRDVLGAEIHEEPVDDGKFTMLKVAGQFVAGFTRPQQIDAVPHWDVYFAVTDADAGIEAAVAAGGTVLTGAFDVAGVGRMALLQDPQGASFWILQDEEQSKARADTAR